jgi:hypothetical protein
MFNFTLLKLKIHSVIKNGIFLLISISLCGALHFTPALAQASSTLDTQKISKHIISPDLETSESAETKPRYQTWAQSALHLIDSLFLNSIQDFPSEEEVKSHPWKYPGDWLENNLWSNGPGLLLLFFLSAFFSTINFYSSMTRADTSLQISSRYLLAWILVNYTLAMILLFLILPEENKFEKIDQTTFLYCLIATAFPELAANIKLQMGDGKAALDIMKYKTQVAQYIDNHIARSVNREKSYYMRFLESFYENNTQEFKIRFTNFMNSNITDPVEIETYTGFLQANPISPGDILSEVQKSPETSQKFLSFFWDIVENIKSFPEWELINGFNYRLTPENAKALVTADITTVGKFMKSRNKDPEFSELSERTHINSTELNAAYFIVKKAWALRFKRALKLGFAGMTILALLILLMIKQGDHNQNSIDDESNEENIRDNQFTSTEDISNDELDLYLNGGIATEDISSDELDLYLNGGIATEEIVPNSKLDPSKKVANDKK